MPTSCPAGAQAWLSNNSAADAAARVPEHEQRANLAEPWRPKVYELGHPVAVRAPGTESRRAGGEAHGDRRTALT